MPFEINTISALALLAGGLVLLWKCAEALVAGAVSLADRLGVSQLVVGLTVVAMGTSAPEAASSIAAVLRNSGGDLALGNVYGSNVANLALVGGLIALLKPLHVQKLTIRREIPVMLAAEMVLWPILMGGSLSRGRALVLLLMFAALIVLTVWIARKGGGDKQLEVDAGNIKRVRRSLGMCLFLIVFGLAGLSLGAKMTVEGAVYLGKQAGLSDAAIGLTIIAFGTSLPELVTCIVATMKGQHDISVGNLVGSNIFNSLLVVGAAGVVKPFVVSPRFAGGVDFWIMVGVGGGFTAAVIIGRRVVGRLSGAILVCAYIGYLAYLVM